MALKRKETPSILSLSRQNLPNLEASTIEDAAKGGYVVHDEQDEKLTIVATGSEVSIALEAASKLKAEGFKTRVVSLPCWSIFDQQPKEYRLSVLRNGAPILSLEALSVRTFQCACLQFPHVPSRRLSDGRSIVMRYLHPSFVTTNDI